MMSILIDHSHLLRDVILYFISILIIFHNCYISAEEDEIEEINNDESFNEINENMNDLEIDEISRKEQEKLEEQLQKDEQEEQELSKPNEIYRHGVDKMGEDEELDFDPSAYIMLHKLTPAWSCPSLDIFGPFQLAYPHQFFAVMGTQATDGQNKLFVSNFSKLHKTTDKGSDDEEEDAEDLDDEVDPEFESRAIPHPGTVNRVRVHQADPMVAATFSDDGNVYIWDISEAYQSFRFGNTSVKSKILYQENHNAEGFALAWGTKGRLLAGDRKNKIHLTLMNETSFVLQKEFTGHTGSVEDVQWSPSESEVFVSGSADKTVKFWDTRAKKCAMSFQAASCDVNALSWNKRVTYLLAAGADDGSFRIFDLRSLKSSSGKICESVAHFQWHSDQITSLEWDPTDESAIAVAGADGQVTIWDLSVEKDTEEQDADVADIPPQLMFVHMGQQDTKEVHYHPQIPGLLISTAEDSINIWKPAIEVGQEPKNDTE